jgi:hypothetical protein
MSNEEIKLPLALRRFRDVSSPARYRFGLVGIDGELGQNATSQAVVLLASRYAVAPSLRIYLRCDCAGVPGTIVDSDPIVNGRATQARVRGRFCPREQVRWSGDLEHPA